MERSHAVRGRAPGLLRRLLWGLGLGMLAAACALVAWQHLALRREPRDELLLAARGREAFVAHCAVCHGESLQGRELAPGQIVPPLDKPGFAAFFWLLPAAMEAWVRSQIAEGAPGMPPFGALLDGETLDALALYLRLVNSGQFAPR